MAESNAPKGAAGGVHPVAGTEFTSPYQFTTPIALYRTEKAAALERAKSRGGPSFVTSGRCPLTRVSGRPAA